MNSKAALEKAADVMRRKHFALATERSYCAWLKRYCDFIVKLPAHIPSEQKLEQFLTALAKDDVAASTQNQAFNAIIFSARKPGRGVEKHPVAPGVAGRISLSCSLSLTPGFSPVSAGRWGQSRFNGLAGAAPLGAGNG